MGVNKLYQRSAGICVKFEGEKPLVRNNVLFDKERRKFSFLLNFINLLNPTLLPKLWKASHQSWHYIQIRAAHVTFNIIVKELIKSSVALSGIASIFRMRNIKRTSIDGALDGRAAL